MIVLMFSFEIIRYRGLYEVVKRNDKFFKIRMNDKLENILIDRLKSVFMPVDDGETNMIKPNVPVNSNLNQY